MIPLHKLTLFIPAQQVSGVSSNYLPSVPHWSFLKSIIWKISSFRHPKLFLIFFMDYGVLLKESTSQYSEWLSKFEFLFTHSTFLEAKHSLLNGRKNSNFFTLAVLGSERNYGGLTFNKRHFCNFGWSRHVERQYNFLKFLLFSEWNPQFQISVAI